MGLKDTYRQLIVLNRKERYLLFSFFLILASLKVKRLGVEKNVETP